MIKFVDQTKPEEKPRTVLYRDMPPFSLLVRKDKNLTMPISMHLGKEWILGIYSNKLVPNKLTVSEFETNSLDNEFEVWQPPRSALKISCDNIIAKRLKLFKQGMVVLNTKNHGVYVILDYNTVILLGCIDGDGLYLASGYPCASFFATYEDDWFIPVTLTITRTPE